MAVEDSSPFGGHGVRASKEEEQYSGANVWVEFVFAYHPVGNELIERHVAWSIVP